MRRNGYRGRWRLPQAVHRQNLTSYVDVQRIGQNHSKTEFHCGTTPFLHDTLPQRDGFSNVKMITKEPIGIELIIFHGWIFLW